MHNAACVVSTDAGVELIELALGTIESLLLDLGAVDLGLGDA